jgi:hypothetical protein
MKTCKHCGSPIIWVEDYIWIHTGRGASLTADRCRPEYIPDATTTFAEPEARANTR